MEDALTPYMPLPRKLLKGLLGHGVGVKNCCFPTFQQLRERWSIMLDAYKEQTRVKSLRPNYIYATMWRQMSLSYSSSDKAATFGRHISAEVCELQQIARNHNIDPKSEKPRVKKGWEGQPKGPLQVLWERGWIDEG
jgi:hypothetical protein